METRLPLPPAALAHVPVPTPPSPSLVLSVVLVPLSSCTDYPDTLSLLN